MHIHTHTTHIHTHNTHMYTHTHKCTYTYTHPHTHIHTHTHTHKLTELGDDSCHKLTHLILFPGIFKCVDTKTNLSGTEQEYPVDLEFGPPIWGWPHRTTCKCVGWLVAGNSERDGGEGNWPDTTWSHRCLCSWQLSLFSPSRVLTMFLAFRLLKVPLSTS